MSRQTEPHAIAEELIRTVRGQLGSARIDLAFLFLSAHHAGEAQTLSLAIRQALNPQTLVGCTGEGVIATTQEVEQGPAATLWAAHLPEVSLHPVRLAFSSVHDQFSLKEWPEEQFGGGQSPVFLLFADPFSTPMQDVLSLTEERYPRALALGGLAGGGKDLGENRLLLNDEVYSDGLVGVALAGRVSIRTIISQGCRPIGDRFIVTKSDHNVIHELGGEPALSCLEKVFAELSSSERTLAQRALRLSGSQWMNTVRSRTR
ncbi:MAG: FIST N-terminal domain-containing protein [Nitrospiraceae bacterium]